MEPYLFFHVVGVILEVNVAIWLETICANINDYGMWTPHIEDVTSCQHPMVLVFKHSFLSQL